MSRRSWFGLQQGPSSRPNDAVWSQAAFLLEPGNGSSRLTAISSVHGETMTGTAQGFLKLYDIPPLEGGT
ncbi:MAG: hypothetical protein OEY77_02530, partial [Nitrospira sp.]|nr:hypothetical protein [Nitrospira sp.]